MAPSYPDHGGLSSGDVTLMAAVAGNGQMPSPKARLAQRECRQGSWRASGALGGLLLAVVQRRACASAAEQMATAWSAAAAVVSEGEGEARNGESRSVTSECGHVMARWSPTWPG